MSWKTSYKPLNKANLKLLKVGSMAKTYEMTVPNSGELTFTDRNGKVSSWELMHFHFHSPSEHLYDGKHRRLEIHLVHYALIDGKPSD